MDPEILLTAVLIGFGFGNIFLCALVAMGVSVGRGWEVGAAFISGRFLGILALGLFIAFFGWFVDLDPRLLLLIFALMSLLFGTLVLLWPRVAARLRIIRHCLVGECEHKTASDSTDHDCSACPSSARCSQSSEPSHNHRSLSTASVTVLGFVRGATPCLKILLLVPLILTLPLLDSLAVTALYALSSSVYTVIGIMAGTILGMAATEKWSPHLTRAGAFLMICIGIYYVYKFWTYSCPGGF